LIKASTAADRSPLPAATTPPSPLPNANESPLPSHQVFGFAPYWTLGQSSAFDVADLTTIAYFSVDVNADGSLDESGPGWNGLQSQALAALESRAHQADDRVVLTVTCFDQGTLDQITADPTAPARLASALVPLLKAKDLDGVNLDFEGTGPRDQSGLTNLVATVSSALRAADSSWQVTMDTYASSASSNAGYYNIAALAPSVDAFFVMSYSLNLDANSDATSPLTSQMFSDLTAIREYLGVVPASKVILGLPFFGYDWPTTGPSLGAAADGAATAVSADQVTTSGQPLYWDADTDTAWSSYQVGSQWHQSFFDNATSLYLAAQLASSYNLAGDGIWALGMDGNDPAMVGAVDGHSPPLKDLPSGPAPSDSGSGSTSTSAPAASPSTDGSTTTTATLPNPLTGSPEPTTPGSSSTSSTTGVSTTTTVPTYFYLGELNGKQVTLTLAGWPGLQDTQQPQSEGELTGFSTNDPAYQCLESSPGLTVNAYTDRPGLDVVVASAPTDCTSVEFFFPTSVLESG
jgi:GH18 family chitinase